MEQRFNFLFDGLTDDSASADCSQFNSCDSCISGDPALNLTRCVWQSCNNGKLTLYLMSLNVFSCVSFLFIHSHKQRIPLIDMWSWPQRAISGTTWWIIQTQAHAQLQLPSTQISVLVNNSTPLSTVLKICMWKTEREREKERGV